MCVCVCVCVCVLLANVKIEELNRTASGFCSRIRLSAASARSCRARPAALIFTFAFGTNPKRMKTHSVSVLRPLCC